MKSHPNIRTLSNSVIPFSPAIGEAFGICGALIIQQIHYWVTSDTAQNRDGHAWVYNPHKKWAEQLKVYNEKTIRNKLLELAELGIVVAGQFNKKGYDRTKWYRLDYEKLVSGMNLSSSTHVSRLVAYGKNFRIDTEENIPFDTEEMSVPIPETTTETTTESLASQKTTPYFSEKDQLNLFNQELLSNANNMVHCMVVVTPPKTIKLKVGVSNPDEIPTIKEPTMKSVTSVSAILESLKVGNGTSKSKATNTSGSLQSVWRNNVTANHPTVGCLAAFTKQQQGQFSYIAKALSPDADGMVLTIIQKWVGYCKFVAAQSGLKVTPDVPNIGFLVKHVGEASSFCRVKVQLIALPKKYSHLAPLTKVGSPPQGAVSSFPVIPPVGPDVDNEVASLADILAWKHGKD